MKLNETTVKECRYGDDALKLFVSAVALWVDATPDYQGQVKILGRAHDGRLFWCEWSYGSCSGCDEWEAKDLTSDQIQAEIARATAWFDDKEHALAFFRMRGPNGQAQVDALLREVSL